MRHRDKKAAEEAMLGSAQGIPQPPATEPLRGRCGACGHVWVVAQLPMALNLVAKACARATCPACAGTKVFVATADQPPADHQPVGEVRRG
jgi:hypothetical protein